MMYSSKKCYRCKCHKVICYLSGNSFLYYCQGCHHEWKRQISHEDKKDDRRRGVHGISSSAV